MAIEALGGPNPITVLYGISKVLPDTPGTWYSRRYRELSAKQAALVQAQTRPTATGEGAEQPRGGGPGPRSAPTDADYKKYGIEPPFNPPVRYEEKPVAKKPAKPPKPLTSEAGRAAGRAVGSGIGVGIGIEIFEQATGIAEEKARAAEKAADAAERAADKAAARLEKRQAEIAAERAAAEAVAIIEARERKLEREVSRGRAAAAIEKDWKELNKRAEAELKEVLKGQPQAVLGEIDILEPLPPPMAPGFSFPAVPDWLQKAAQVARVYDTFKRPRPFQITNYRDPLSQPFFDEQYLGSSFVSADLTSSMGTSLASGSAAALSTDDEVCSCRPRRQKRRRKSNVKRICYDRKL